MENKTNSDADPCRASCRAALCVVVASRGKFDGEAVEQALHANSAYVALAAIKKRAQEIRRGLELRGEPSEKLATLDAPAGAG